MKVLLLGGNGQLGTHLRYTLSPLQGEVVVATRTGDQDTLACDINDSSALRALLRAQRPHLVINAAAYTSVDKAETEAEHAFAINGEVPGIIGGTVAAWNGAVVHYSTDYVFDGHARTPYAEFDVTAPLGVYGASKLAGEQALASSGADYLIIRTAWVYSLHGRNFLTTMLRLASERSLLRVVDDQQGTPTSARFLAHATAHIANVWMAKSNRRKLSGVYHLTNDGNTTWCRFTRAIMEEAIALGRLERTPAIEAISTSDYPTPAQRPLYSVLSCARIKQAFCLDIPSWQDELHTVLAETS
ncbi:dTDP-4-dehydrorhamnose reductase [Dyella sp. BiH032]|uniref:dTDP-4-dehydrorhamnose reductase n=1 Tax=Dyella sp. BiH032 TaxID=3075430 RepID=UPI0028930458|nr:dTDP-4-dehydrorhamnose reductase [Dyella sp. BiH032]WNL45557.1 dTDP-4-dehydrorhamnose reductase [Dyella sp. BiH032]